MWKLSTMTQFSFCIQNNSYQKWTDNPLEKFKNTHFDFNKRKRTRSDSVLCRKPKYQQKIQQTIDNTKKPPKTSITQPIAYRLRTVSWSNNSHPTGAVLFKSSTNDVGSIIIIEQRKRSDSALWQKPLYQQKGPKSKVRIQKCDHKTSITQRLLADLGQSVWVTTAIQLVSVKPANRIQTFLQTTKVCN